MASTIKVNRQLVSDVDGNPISQENHVKISIRTADQSWMLDADRGDELVSTLLTYARETTGRGRARQNGSFN